MFACSSEDVVYNENQNDSSNNLAGRSSATTQQMDHFAINGNPEEGWYDEEKADCSAVDTAACISITVDDPKDIESATEMVSNLRSNISNARIIFEDNLELADDLFDPIVVDGVISNFFRLEHNYNLSDETNYFKIKRNSDNELVGVKKFKL